MLVNTLLSFLRGRPSPCRARSASAGRSRRYLPSLEALEPRYAPATLAYTDVDGDKVTITSSVGRLAGRATIVGGQLQMLDLSDPSFRLADITFSVVKVANGDGRANVGYINGDGRDLGNVTVKGDLGRIVCGDGDPL